MKTKKYDDQQSLPVLKEMIPEVCEYASGFNVIVGLNYKPEEANSFEYIAQRLDKTELLKGKVDSCQLSRMFDEFRAGMDGEHMWNELMAFPDRFDPEMEVALLVGADVSEHIGFVVRKVGGLGDSQMTELQRNAAKTTAQVIANVFGKDAN